MVSGHPAPKRLTQPCSYPAPCDCSSKSPIPRSLPGWDNAEPSLVPSPQSLRHWGVMGPPAWQSWFWPCLQSARIWAFLQPHVPGPVYLGCLLGAPAKARGLSVKDWHGAVTACIPGANTSGQVTTAKILTSDMGTVSFRRETVCNEELAQSRWASWRR